MKKSMSNASKRELTPAMWHGVAVWRFRRFIFMKAKD
ncbi:hypothetical protein ERHA55_47500 [Erwinia rhapontici]|nr:hypothetical protein ERHA55_47500 [Erwinia rhapontici]